MPVKTAIIGSGPGAFYTAEALVKSAGEFEIDIIERLPAPFGLIRYGVAPDHQSTKNVIRNYDRTAQHDSVCFFGNVEVGTDISIEQLREMYDAVVIATGAPRDNPLAAPGADKIGVFGSAEFVGWYNGHPDYHELAPDLSCNAVAVIGNGNVALDIARLLVKTPDELKDSDISYVASEALSRSGVRDVYLIGRRGPIEAKFTNVELREMAELADCKPVVQPDDLPAEVGELEDAREQRLKERNLATFNSFVEVDEAGKNRRVHFLFYASPLEVLGDDKVTGLKLEKTEVVDGRAKGTGESFTIDCGMVIPAIGYRSIPIPGIPFDEKAGKVVNEGGKVDEGLYVVGWAKRGPTGVISSNRTDGKEAAAQIAEQIRESDKPGRAGLRQCLADKGQEIISYADWQKIDEEEKAAASDGAPRRKFVTVEEMMESLNLD